MRDAICHRFGRLGTPRAGVSKIDGTHPGLAWWGIRRAARRTLAAVQEALDDGLGQRPNTTYLDNVKFTSRATADPATTARNRFTLPWSVVLSHS